MSNEINVKINKKSWSIEEDAKLIKLIDELGVSGSWTMISSRMGDRSGKQCRERYHNHLKSDINKSAFTKEEDDLVNELQLKFGNQWAKISKFFTGRSDNAVKNRWHIINRSKNDIHAGIAATAPVAPKKPIIPMLALNFQSAITHNSVNDLANGMDMLNLYHSHCEHAHEPTMSSRSVVVPSSGRRSAETIAWRRNYDDSISSCSDSSDSEEDKDRWIDELLTTDYSDSSDEEWTSGDENSHVIYEFNKNVFDNVKTVSPRLKEAAQMVYDAFSEAALTQREDPAVDFDFFDLTEDVSDLFDNETELIGVKLTPIPYGSKPVASIFKRFNECLPRLTPRSPAYPVGNLKRHRGVQPGGSPVIRNI